MIESYSPLLEKRRRQLSRHSTFLYVIAPGDDHMPVKIAGTTKLLKHYREACTNSPVSLKIVAKIRAPHDWIARIHGRLAHARMHGSWFARTADVAELIDAMRSENVLRVEEWLEARGG